MITREVVLRETVPPLLGVKLEARSPVTGKIVQIIRHWPGGCNALVDLAVGHHDTWVLPNQLETYVALDNATPVVNVDEPIQKNEMLWARIMNGDGANAHAITTTIILMGEE